MITPDSFDFAQQSQYSVLNGGLWGSQHPPLTALLWKIDPWAMYGHAPVLFADVRPLVLLNVVIGTACWLTVAYAACSVCRRTETKCLVFAVVLLGSLSPEVAGWDSALLSESVSISLVALLTAFVLLYAKHRRQRLALGVAASVVALCASRDTTLLLCCAVVLTLVLSIRQNRTVLVSGLVLGAAIVLWGNHASDQRWKVPLRNSMAWAIQVDNQGRWFERHGMPRRANTVALLLDRPTASFESDPRAKQLRTWINRHGRTTWYLFLTEHPSYTAEPLTQLPAELDGKTAENRQYLESSPLLRFSVYRHGLLFWLMLAAAGASAVYLRDRMAVRVSLAVCFAALATYLVVPDLDRWSDLERHLVVAQLSVRVVAVALILWAIEEAVVRASNAREGSSEGFEVSPGL